jgi:hypothetical protein
MHPSSELDPHRAHRQFAYTWQPFSISKPYLFNLYSKIHSAFEFVVHYAVKPINTVILR